MISNKYQEITYNTMYNQRQKKNNMERIKYQTLANSKTQLKESDSV